MRFVGFREFAAPYWDAGSWDVYQVVARSRSGQSLWLDMDGDIRCVPVACLVGLA